MRYSSLAFVLVLAVGCAPAAPSTAGVPDLSSQVTAITRGETGFVVVVALSSESGAAVSTCSTEVQRKGPAGWAAVDTGFCLDLFTGVPARGTAAMTFHTTTLATGDSVRVVPRFVQPMAAGGTSIQRTELIVGAPSNVSVVPI